MDSSSDLIATVTFLLACFVFVVYYFFLVLPKRRYESLPGPPIPSYVLGNIVEVNKNLHDFPQTLLELSLKYGPAFRLFFPLQTLFVVTHPEDIRFITVTRNYPKGDSFVNSFHALAPGGLLILDRHTHPIQRTAIAKLLNARFLPDVAVHLEVEAKILFSNLDNAAVQQRSINIDKALIACLLDVIGRVTLGKSLDVQTNPENPVARSFLVCIEEVFTNMMWYPFRRLIPFTQRRMNKNLSVLREFISGAIEVRRTESPVLRQQRRSQDLLEIFLALPDATIDSTIGQVITFLFAGHDTTAHTLSFLVLEVCKNPSLQVAMAAEIDKVMGDLTADEFVMPDTDRLSELVFCHQVWQEALRMYPAAASGTLRKVDRTDTLPHCGFPVSKGMHVLIPPFVAHRSPEFWDAPLKFAPERFAPEALRTRRGRARSFFPFSAGPRSCIGNFIAKFEAMILIALLFGRYSMQLSCDPEQVHPYQSLTLRPRTDTKDGFFMGLPVNLTRRRFKG